VVGVRFAVAERQAKVAAGALRELKKNGSNT
jgi:hypothetical protein